MRSECSLASIARCSNNCCTTNSDICNQQAHKSITLEILPSYQIRKNIAYMDNAIQEVQVLQMGAAPEKNRAKLLEESQIKGVSAKWYSRPERGCTLKRKEHIEELETRGATVEKWEVLLEHTLPTMAFFYLIWQLLMLFILEQLPISVHWTSRDRLPHFCKWREWGFHESIR